MKQCIIFFYSVCTILSLAACDDNNKDHATNHLKEVDQKSIAGNSMEVKNAENKIITDFIYDIGPRFSPIKKDDVDKAISIDAFLDKDS